MICRTPVMGRNRSLPTLPGLLLPPRDRQYCYCSLIVKIAIYITLGLSWHESVSVFADENAVEASFLQRLRGGERQTLVTYGTSLTAGGAWVEQLRQDLEKRFPQHISVVNSGQGGMWSKWGIENLESRVIAKQPDAVIIEFAINDAYLEYKTTVAMARANLVQMINRIREANPSAEVILMTMNPPVGIHLERRPHITEYYDMYREVAADLKLLLIDHHANWQQILEQDRATFDRYVPDGIHPAEEGCQAVITPAIVRAIHGDGATTVTPPIQQVPHSTERDVPREYTLALQPVDLPPGESHPIDRLLSRYFSLRGITPSNVVGDEQFARRVSLDLIGLPPTQAQLEQFLRDGSSDKRERYIQRLLADSESYTAHWITFWSDHFRIGSEVNAGAFDNDNTKAPQEWLLSMLRQSVPYDELAGELIAGEIYDKYALCVAPTQDIISPVERAEMQIATTISQVFLGIQLKCAACHDSFIDRWTMQDAWGLAVALGGQELEVHRCQTATGQMALPQFPLATLGDIDPQLEIGPKRQRVAELMTCRANGLFPRTIVNRLWARLIGRGLIEPLDEMMEHEPWNAELLDWLAAEFVRQGYDLKKLLLLIATSEAYQMHPVVRDKPLRTDEDYIFRGPELRSLTAEQIIDTIAVLGQMATPDANAVSTQKRAWQRTRTDLMTVLGRPTRDVVVSARVQEASALMALEMLNGQELNGLVQKAATVQAAKSIDAAAFGEQIFMLLLSRRPSDNERTVLEQIGGKNFSDEIAADIIWTVAMLPEFLLLP